MDSSGDICGTHDDACSHCCCHGFVQSDRIYDDRLQSYNSWFTSIYCGSQYLYDHHTRVYFCGGDYGERRDFETSAECSECLDWTCSGGRGHCDRSCLCHVCSDHRLCFRNHRSGRRADDPCNDRLQLSEVVFYGAGSQCGIFGNPDPPKHPNDSLYDDSRSIGIKIVRCWHASRADRGRCVLNLYCYL